MADKLYTPVFRASFAHPFTKKKMKDSERETYGLAAIWTPADFLPSDKVAWKALKDALNEASMEAFKKPWKDLPPGVFKKGLRDGTEKEDFEGFGAGTYFANLTSNDPIPCASLKGVPIGTAFGNAELFYSGCRARATVNIKAFDKKGGRGVAIYIQTLQKIGEGKRFADRGNADAAKEFESAAIEDAWLVEPDEDDDVAF